MDPFTIFLVVTALIGAASSAYSAKQQMDAADDAEDLGRANAEKAQSEANRQAALLKDEQDMAASRRRGSLASGGVGGKTQETFMASMASKERKDRDWLEKSKNAAVDAELIRGRAAGASGRAGAAASVGDAAAYAGKAAKASKTPPSSWPT